MVTSSLSSNVLLFSPTYRSVPDEGRIVYNIYSCFIHSYYFNMLNRSKATHFKWYCNSGFKGESWRQIRESREANWFGSYWMTKRCGMMSVEFGGKFSSITIVEVQNKYNFPIKSRNDPPGRLQLHLQHLQLWRNVLHGCRAIPCICQLWQQFWEKNQMLRIAWKKIMYRHQSILIAYHFFHLIRGEVDKISNTNGAWRKQKMVPLGCSTCMVGRISCRSPRIEEICCSLWFSISLQARRNVSGNIMMIGA